MSDRFQEVKCPNCGAPLDLKPGHERIFKCEFCGTTLRDETSQEEEEIGAVPRLIIQTTAHPPPATVALGSGAGRAIGCIIAVIVLASVIPAVIGVLGAAGITLGSIFAVVGGEGGLEQLLPSGQVVPDIYSYGAVRLLPAEDGSQPDFVGVASLADDTQRLVYLDFDAETPLRWQSEPLAEEASYVYNPFAANNSFVYFSFGTTLLAFNRLDGTTAWQTTLPDQVTNLCADCLQVSGQRVFTLTSDGTLQAYNAQTGQPAWNVRLGQAPRELLVVGGNPAVRDEQEGRVGLEVYNALDGSLLRAIQPQCVNEIFEDDPQEPYLSDPMWALPDGQSVIFGFGSYEPYCLQRWDVAAGVMAWEALVERDAFGPGLGIRTDDRVLVTAEGVYLPSDRQLFYIQAADGTISLLANHEDYEITPLGVAQEVLIATAYRTRGTGRNEIWALEPDGALRWSFVPTAEDMMDDPLSEVAYQEGIWSAYPAADGVIVMTAYSEPKRIGFEKLSLQDGASSGQNIQPLVSDFDAGSMWFSVLGWDGSTVWVVTTDVVRVFDYQTGEELQRWP